MKEITYSPIGIIHTPFKTIENVPIQPVAAKGIEGTVELEASYCEGLQDLAGFSHIVLIYHFHLSNGFSLRVVPFLDTATRGVFSTRAPRRPNPIGLSVVELTGIDGNVLFIKNVDMVDGTPLLDIKPHIPDFAGGSPVRTGWFSCRPVKNLNRVADERFKGGTDYQDKGD